MFSRLFASPKGRIISAIVFFGLAMLAGGVVGFLDGYASASGQPTFLESDNVIWIVGLGAVVLAVASFAYGTFWMKSIDEAAQEAHKWSWYWGGSVGLSLGMVAFVLSLAPVTAQWTIPTLNGRTDPVAYAATGAFGLMLLLTAGYGIAWAWWWFSRR
ncbi:MULTISPECIES: hypothetical protein [unclassified Brevundimonas]|uniref:hypothetical protein n=1 Tax=unclassified Brevundimonas TaxID=2622653 RepID=UPI0025C45AF1|nr:MULTISPECIES: hypothetical protein [unclassified Brevundimonas]